ncbi:MAG: trypsin-like peptidase domain-containing protein [Ilumatobacter sp.]
MTPPRGRGWSEPSVWAAPAHGQAPATTTDAVAHSAGQGQGATLSTPIPGPPPSPHDPPPLRQSSPNEPKRSRRWPKRIAVGVAFVTAMVGSGVVGAVIMDRLEPDSTPPQRASDVALDVGAPRTDAFPPIDVAAVADFVAPSVVTISADVEGPLGAGGSIGTGVITTRDGEIVTNAHVVRGATEIRVRLAGESEPRPATLLAADPGNDLALLRIAGDDFVPATFAEPATIRIGDEVVAIGFALDLDGDPSVTLGIVSALDRTIQTVAGALNGLVQTDAAISSGNSGGPLVNAVGQVVGINTAVARGDATVAASNIGFAISVGEALPVIESLREQADGTVRDEGFLGVGLEDRRDGGQGAVIAAVTDDSPAAEAGIIAGDIVIAIDGIAIDGGAGLVAAVKDQEPGDVLTIQLLRGGDEITVDATLAAQPPEE